MKGYYVSNWVIGKDISKEIVQKYGASDKQLYVTIAFEPGEPESPVMKKEVWERQK